jgi:hypothetical protein
MTPAPSATGAGAWELGDNYLDTHRRFGSFLRRIQHHQSHRIKDSSVCGWDFTSVTSTP